MKKMTKFFARQSQKASATLQQIFEKLILRSGEV